MYGWKPNNFLVFNTNRFFTLTIIPFGSMSQCKTTKRIRVKDINKLAYNLAAVTGDRMYKHGGKVPCMSQAHTHMWAQERESTQRPCRKRSTNAVPVLALLGNFLWRKWATHLGKSSSSERSLCRGELHKCDSYDGRNLNFNCAGWGKCSFGSRMG